MNESPDKWGLTILAAHSQRWSQQVAKEFRDSVSSMIADVEGRMRTEHSSLHLRPLYLAAGSLDALKAKLGGLSPLLLSTSQTMTRISLF